MLFITSYLMFLGPWSTFQTWRVLCRDENKAAADELCLFFLCSCHRSSMSKWIESTASRLWRLLIGMRVCPNQREVLKAARQTYSSTVHGKPRVSNHWKVLKFYLSFSCILQNSFLSSMHQVILSNVTEMRKTCILVRLYYRGFRCKIKLIMSLKPSDTFCAHVCLVSTA